MRKFKPPVHSSEELLSTPTILASLHRSRTIVSQEPLRLEGFSRCQGAALTRAKRVVREEWPQRVGSTVHDALRRQFPEGTNASQGGAGGASSQSLDQVGERESMCPRQEERSLSQGRKAAF